MVQQIQRYGFVILFIRCLKYNQLTYDEEGIDVMKPSPAEFNLRLTLTASSARQSLIGY